MKKIFFSFTIATMMVLLMSCVNSGRQSMGDMETTSGNLIENDYLAAILPDEWEELTVYDNGFTACIKDEDGDGDKVAIWFDAYDANYDMKGWVERNKMKGNITDKTSDVTIGGITFQQYASQDNLYFVS